MPIFGDKTRFAVEYNLSENHGGEWLFGRFCYWCDGVQVGDHELGTSLRDVLFQLERIEGDAGRRANPRFRGMSVIQVFSLLDAALFGGEAFARAEVANDEQWARHLIIPAVGVFDEWKGFLVEEESSGRLITAHVPGGRLQECLLRPGEVDEVLKEVIHDLGTLYGREAEDAGG
jgi:hypothetical protein